MKRLVAKLTALIAVVVMAVPASADDAQIAKQIIAKLNQQKQTAKLKGFDLGVQVDKGTVTMMGQVASADQAMLALDVARRIPGVKLVVNDLYVNQQQAQPAPPAPQPVAVAAAAQPQASAPQPQAAAQPQAAQQQAALQQAALQQAALQQAALQQAAPQQPQQAAPQQTAQPVAYQQPLPHYNATGAVGSAVAHPQPQRPAAFAQSTIRQTSAQVAPANYVHGGSYAGNVVGGGYGGAYGGAAVSDNPSVPGYAWPSYAASPNYGAVAYPQQYSATAWPYIGPFYPYPQVPLGWRRVSLEWDDGWWFLDFTKK